MLDYTLETASERCDLANQLNANGLINLKNAEAIANYILHCTEQKTKSAFSASLSQKEVPTEEMEIAELRAQKNSYTKPRLKPLWELFPDEKIATEVLKAKAADESTPSDLAYKMRKWRLELLLDIGTASQIIRNAIPIHGGFASPPPVEIELFVDFTNSFHMKQLVANYAQLKQTEPSRHIMEWLDSTIENTPLKPWQKHLLIGRIEGVAQPTLGVEIAQIYGKILSPSYMSQTMRQIYTKLASQAELEEEKFAHKNQPWAWEYCSECGEKRFYKEFGKTQLARLENGKNGNCKICEEKKKK